MSDVRGLGGSGEPSTSPSKRPTKACLRCRKRKVKCSGGHPCTRCIRTKYQCQYDEGRKVTISEKYLRDLERNVHPPPPIPLEVITAQSPDHPEVRDSPQSQSIEDRDVHNPLTGGTNTSTKDALGGHHFIGASSTWGFAWRARQLLKTLPNLTTANVEEVDDMAHARIGSTTVQTRHNASQLPQETIKRYLSNYDYHVAPLWYFCSLTAFADPPNFPKGSNTDIDTLFLAQFNLIMAIGKLLEQGKSVKETPGAPYFWFGSSLMQMLSESQVVAQKPILVSQNYCLIAFYYHAINMRNDAYINIGKATRIAVTQGLHRISKNSAGDFTEETQVRFWWSLYYLDITFSSLMGSPIPMQENDIITRDALPFDGFPSPIPLMQLVKVARVMANTISNVYGRSTHESSSFVRNILKVIDDVDLLVKTMATEYKIDDDANGHISRTSATLHLSMYQTVVVAVRPVLFQLVEQKVALIASQGPPGDFPSVSRGVRYMLRKLIEAATSSVKVLESLNYQGQLQVFMSFDVTAAFSAGVILTLAAFVSADKSIDLKSKVHELIQALEELGSRGNEAAKKRCTELRELDHLLNSAVQNPVISNASSSDMPQTLENNETPPADINVLEWSLLPDNSEEDESLSALMVSEHTWEDFDSIMSHMTGHTELFPFAE